MSSSGGTSRVMRAFRANEGAREAQLRPSAVPEIGPEDVLIKVGSAGLAPGVLTLLAQGKLKHLPTTLGHEVAGTIEETGRLVRSLKVGQRVSLYPNTSCGACKYCGIGDDQMCPEAGIIGFNGFGAKTPLFDRYHQGGLADYVRAPYWLVDVLPDNVNFDVGAKLHDIANAMRVLKVAKLAPGSSVLMTAPTGSMGTACLKLAPFFGISHLVLVGRSTKRLEAVKKLTDIKCDVVGIDQLQDDWVATKGLVRRLSQVRPNGFDAIIDFTPSGTDIYQIVFTLTTNGSFVHMGGNFSVFPIPLGVIMVNCWNIVGTRNHSRLDVKIVLQWLEQGVLDMDDLITHRYKLEDIKNAVVMLQERSEPAWMIVVNP